MPKKQAVDQAIYLDEAEGFLLEHALFSPPRSWRPLQPDQPQTERLAGSRKKMDWEGEVRQHPDEPFDLPVKKEGDDDANKERCVICLMALRDRTIVGVCGHEFCFECIGVWANQSRRCPLCSADMAPFLLHDLDDSTPTKFYLPPLPQKKLPSMSLPGPSRRLPLPEERHDHAKVELDELDYQVERRREIYHNELYVKHIASNGTTRFRPNPTPRQIAEDGVLIQRATAFLRRELRVWSLVDVEFLTNYILSLLKAIDVRSEPAIQLLAEFLDSPNGEGYPHGAEHFAHELYSFLRSPYKELRRYDEVAQYDPIPSARSDRSASPQSSRSRSILRSASRSPSRSSVSRSPSPRAWHQRDTFIAKPSSKDRRWDVHDSWVDPDYAIWLEEDRIREEERKKRRISLQAEREARVRRRAEPVELLPEPTLPALQMDVVEEESMEPPILNIKGAAKEVTPARLSLLERLAKAKAAAAITSPSIMAPPPVPLPTSDETTGAALKSTGVRAVVQARLHLRRKLASEKQVFVYNQNESKAQELRRRLIEAREARQAAETDAVLKKLDRADRAREIRRRLMAEKMMAAETESEKRQRELKEKLLGEKRAKLLRATLLEKKRGVNGVPAIEVR